MSPKDRHPLEDAIEPKSSTKIKRNVSPFRKLAYFQLLIRLWNAIGKRKQPPKISQLEGDSETVLNWEKFNWQSKVAFLSNRATTFHVLLVVDFALKNINQLSAKARITSCATFRRVWGSSKIGCICWNLAAIKPQGAISEKKFDISDFQKMGCNEPNLFNSSTRMKIFP